MRSQHPLLSRAETQMLSEAWHPRLPRPQPTLPCKLRPIDITPLHTKDWEGPRLSAKGRERIPDQLGTYALLFGERSGRGLKFLSTRSRETCCPKDK